MQKNIESGVQLFSRVGRKASLQGINPQLFPEGGPYPNQTVEITGDPHIDKTSFLIDFIVRTILPNRLNSEWKDSAAVIINTEFQINLFKIIKTVEIFITKHNITEQKNAIIENALKNLTIFNCYNLDELEVTFFNLEKIIQSNENISLVVIDNITAQYWISKVSTNTLSYYQHSLKNFETLHNIIKELQVLLIFVRHEDSNRRKKFTNKIDFKIVIENINNSFKVTVTNYEKEGDICVPLSLEPVLDFCNPSN